ncbi:MAG: hypothetical protein U0414_43030 [Polyangiaceae bacterium]
MGQPELDTATSSVRYQRLRRIGSEVAAIGSVNRGINGATPPHAGVRIRRLATPQAKDDPYMNSPKITDGIASHYLEATDYVGDDAAFIAGDGSGPASGQLGNDSEAPHAFVAEAHAVAMHGELVDSLEPSKTNVYSRVAAIASLDPDTKTTWGVIAANAGSGLCGSGAEGVYATAFTQQTVDLSKCVSIGAPCASFARDDELVPFDLLATETRAIAVGQICSGLGASGAPTGFIVPISDAIPPTLGTAALVVPGPRSSADIVAIREIGDHLVVAGTFTGTITAGEFTLSSAGGIDAFVAILDATTLGFTQAVALGGTGDEIVTDADAQPRAGHSGEWGLYLVGRFTGHADFGCFSADAQGEQAFLAKLWLSSVDDASVKPLPLYLSALGSTGSTRADRVLVAGDELWVSGRIAANATLSVRGVKVPANPESSAATFLLPFTLTDTAAP